ncbi:cyclophilin-like fold protein [Rhodococcus sp. IEGM 1305]|uniref:cyclophilin-like fold protein n=1 Tax=Rhodococcus sp. IEGM 1305 TaxID=3047092 RepID=UPI0024B7DAE6|nr:cyclophilin-like fold protein [Rhodococcus sp. IEGM 1305]MDI9949076.1 cyclophilin-like fold protein [Rhodococcus sp. IEGM 1305]
MRPMITGLVVLATAVTAVAGLTACASTTDSAENSAPSASPTAQPATSQPGQEGPFTQIRLRIGASEATARLYDNATARDFASLIPVTITLHDLGGREKAGPLPRELADGAGQSSYRTGQLGYWPPTNDLAIYYRDDGFTIPDPGIVMIGEIDTGLDAITDADGNGTLTITAA